MPALHTPAPVAPARAASAKCAPTSPARARRRNALLQLAQRHGEVRVRVQDAGRPVPHAADVLELLDELNEMSRLRWGGLRKDEAGAEVVYFKTKT